MIYLYSNAKIERLVSLPWEFAVSSVNVSTLVVLIQGDSSFGLEECLFWPPDSWEGLSDRTEGLTIWGTIIAYSVSRVNSDSQIWEALSPSKWTHIKFHTPFSFINGM